MRNKKGIGPIIAWVMLLGFTISLATLVFIWMKGQTEEMSESTIESVEGEMQCQNVRVNAVKMDACSSLEIQNLGFLTINELVVREFCSESDVNSQTYENINLEPKSSKTETSGAYKKTLETCSGCSCDKVEVMPVIKVSNRKLGCEDRTVEVECQ